MIHKKITLSTSNKNKIEEFKKFGLSFDIVQGLDLKEVAGTTRDVILHKALDAGENILVEDTVLTINGEEIVDIRWRIEELAKLKNPDIKWTTSLAVLDGDHVYIYVGVIDCALVPNADTITIPEDSFGFDGYLVPAPNGFEYPETFHELKLKGEKDRFSPRKFATENLLNKIPSEIVDVDTIQEWTGEYQ